MKMSATSKIEVIIMNKIKIKCKECGHIGLISEDSTLRNMDSLSVGDNLSRPCPNCYFQSSRTLHIILGFFF
mgnify:CR=1 FL=1